MKCEQHTLPTNWDNGRRVCVCVCGERQMGKKLIFWKLLVRTTCSHHFRRMTWKFSFKFSFTFFSLIVSYGKGLFAARTLSIEYILIRKQRNWYPCIQYTIHHCYENVIFFALSVPERRKLTVFFPYSLQSSPSSHTHQKETDYTVFFLHFANDDKKTKRMKCEEGKKPQGEKKEVTQESNKHLKMGRWKSRDGGGGAPHEENSFWLRVLFFVFFFLSLCVFCFHSRWQ